MTDTIHPARGHQMNCWARAANCGPSCSCECHIRPADRGPIDRYGLGQMYLPPERLADVVADIERVDRLEHRMAALPLGPEPAGGEPRHLADPLRNLFEEARRLLLHWHARDTRQQQPAHVAHHYASPADPNPRVRWYCTDACTGHPPGQLNTPCGTPNP